MSDVYVKVAAANTERSALLRENGAIQTRIDRLQRSKLDAVPREYPAINAKIREAMHELAATQKKLRAVDKLIAEQTKANVAAARRPKKYMAGRLQ